jgi:hypothetical protein
MNVAFLIYKRPDLTDRVFNEIAKAKPERLLIVADGPKAGVKDDSENVTGVRNC